MIRKIKETLEKEDLSEKEFNAIALEIFEYQYNRNRFYKNFCIKKGITPGNIRNFKQIPPCPQRAFKYFELTAFETKKPEYVFVSSGTTEGLRSKRYVFYPEIYDNVIYKSFKKFFLPDMDKIKIFVFFTDFQEFKQSSLAYMYKRIFEKFGKKESAYFYKNGKYLFHEFLKKTKKEKEPVAILGTSISLYHLIQYLKENKIRIKLPEGSRILDTGGFKGLKVVVQQRDLYKSYSELLGVDEKFIVNEYGMCELISHYYDANLKFYFENKNTERIKLSLPFLKWRIVDPDTFEDKKEGVLIHYDLANFDACIAILTEDTGIKRGEGFVLKGRVQGFDLRGCSLISELNLKNSGL